MCNTPKIIISVYIQDNDLWNPLIVRLLVLLLYDFVSAAVGVAVAVAVGDELG